MRTRSAAEEGRIIEFFSIRCNSGSHVYSEGQKHAVDAACRFVAAAGSRLGAVSTDGTLRARGKQKIDAPSLTIRWSLTRVCPTSGAQTQTCFDWPFVSSWTMPGTRPQRLPCQFRRQAHTQCASRQRASRLHLRASELAPPASLALQLPAPFVGKLQ